MSRRFAKGGLGHRAWTACAAVAFALGYAVPAPVMAAVPEDAPAAVASLPPTPEAAAPDALEPASGTEIANRIESAAGLAIGGEKLHGYLLRQFYAAHDFEPVWPDRQAQAKALLGAVMRAGEHGLDPELFHAALLRNRDSLSPIDRDLLLSDAFLAYADALARGVLPIEKRMDDEDLTPGPINVAAVLDNAIDSPDPAAAIEALAPNTPSYRALREALRAERAGEKSRAGRLREIEVNLERQRWLPRHLPAERVWVNLADAKLAFYRENQPIFTTRVIVGEVDKQSPELQASISGVLFNPPWYVPRSIITNEIMPKLRRDPGYLSRHHMVWRGNGLLQQTPPSALGQIKFEMPNRFDVYLHDTPNKGLFSQGNRRRSHGCIRVQNPRELAALLLHESVEAVGKSIALGSTNRRMLPAPVPVFVVYQTAFVGSDGKIEFHPDVYDRDQEIWKRLHPPRQTPVAERGSAGQRRG
ncbi:MAG TPA: L,D-transpeptidase family protein [Acetobacteraceae bacterium]|nr:L,D-transpeptidase family protein [Acetobacteraceae bacterium]